jgi:hypothetical protein
MSASVRVRLIVALVALAAAGTAVGVTLATRTDVAKQTSKPPPYAADPTAPPEIGPGRPEALRAWPAGTVRRLRILAERYPRSGLVRLELGLALVLTGQQADATKAWLDASVSSPIRRRGACARPPSPEHPADLPPFVPSFSQPTSAVQARLLRGAAFQQELRPVSAEREFEAAAALAPADPEALTAAAVGLYDKDRPALAFSHLGPLVRRFPHAQTVRFHLGLLLIYFGDVGRARREFALARSQGPRTPLGRRADTLLKAGQKS